MNKENEEIKKKLSKLECQLVKLFCDLPDFADVTTQNLLRWALSLARLTKIKTKKNPLDDLNVDQALEKYREKLLALITDQNNLLNASKAKTNSVLISNLAQTEYENLLSLFASGLTKKQLDTAIEKRPLALTLGGGGGTSYVFAGALLTLEENKITPSIIAGTSMGAIIGAYRAQSKKYSLDKFNALITSTSWEKIARAYSGTSRFGIPATFRLYLHETLGKEFQADNKFLRIKDLEIPFRICVAGISLGKEVENKDLDSYAHLLDNTKVDPAEINVKSTSVLSQILAFTQKPLKAIYLGDCKLTQDFDVLDAIGFSSAIPGVFHYDVLRDDPKMIDVLNKLFEKEKIFRLIDGGFVDNLPVHAAKDGVEQGSCDGYDPFLLSLDSFSPAISKNLIFYPMMKFAAENSREGHLLSHLSIKFKNALSPINFVPTKESFNLAVKYGQEEMLPHITFIKQMIGPIPKPDFCKC